MKSLTTFASELLGNSWLLSSQGYASLANDIRLKLTAPFVSTKSASLNQVTQAEFAVDGSIGSAPQVACIHVNGILVKGASPEQEEELGLCNLDSVSQAFDDALNDPAVAEICMIFNSPGGSVAGIEELGRKILTASKPTKGWTETKACSAAYWLMSQCNTAGCTPSSQVGAIGVMLVLDDISKSLEIQGIRKEAFHGGKFKLIGQPFKPVSPEERAVLQKGVDETYEQFKQAVLNKRQVDPSYLEGLVYEGKNAKAGNLVDMVTDTLDQFLAGSNYNLTSNMTITTKINQPIQAQAVALAAEKQADVPGVPGTKAEAKPEATPEPKAESGHYDGGYIACPGCKLNFKVEAGHKVAGPAVEAPKAEDKPADKPTDAKDSETKEDEQDKQKTEKPNEKLESEEPKKEATAVTFESWRANILGIRPKSASAFIDALNQYVKEGGTKLF
jgi:signal peptide peptidase SppA